MPDGDHGEHERRRAGDEERECRPSARGRARVGGRQVRFDGRQLVADDGRIHPVQARFELVDAQSSGGRVGGEPVGGCGALAVADAESSGGGALAVADAEASGSARGGPVVGGEPGHRQFPFDLKEFTARMI
jgi:hypothetical protein